MDGILSKRSLPPPVNDYGQEIRVIDDERASDGEY